MELTQVSCGSNHTLVLSSDGMEVFSCGDGHHFKLGHGGQNSVNYPQAIPELSDVGVKKVACGKEFSIALTNNGKVIFPSGLIHLSNHSECNHPSGLINGLKQ